MAEPQSPAPSSVLTNPSWERVHLARHPKRPHTLDYIQRLIANFEELHGDRAFSDDHAIVAGLGWFEDRPVMVVGQQKGRDTKQKIFRNFGMPQPEGYRKAMRVMELAAKFSRPIVTLLDTPGAYHGRDAEERGQGRAIAQNLREMSRLGVPVIVVVIGEGGSGGALALGVGNRVYMMENAVYSVISPESCAAIIYRDASQAPLAAAALKMTAPELLELGLIDENCAGAGRRSARRSRRSRRIATSDATRSAGEFRRNEPAPPDRRPLRKIPPNGSLLCRIHPLN